MNIMNFYIKNLHFFQIYENKFMLIIILYSLVFGGLLYLKNIYRSSSEYLVVLIIFIDLVILVYAHKLEPFLMQMPLVFVICIKIFNVFTQFIVIFNQIDKYTSMELNNV